MNAGPLMLDLEGPQLTGEEQELLRHPMVGGVILFARNCIDRAQVCQLTAAVKTIRPELLLAVDQEGGRVQRLREGYTRFPPMAKLGALFAQSEDKGAELLRDAGWLLAAEVVASGFDFSFAPVLDVDDRHCEVIADRAFSAHPQQVAEAARHFIAGLHEAGMAATGKHFPGHGAVTADSHLETPRDERDLAAIRARDIIPFAALAPLLDGVMPAHIVFPAVDDNCVGFSRKWLSRILREELAFEGVIFSDDLSMKGADMVGSYTRKAALALDAGCDMILVCNNRAGALEVLDYLERRHPPRNPRLAAMKARRGWDWRALEQDPRRLQTQARLAELTA